MSKKITVFFLFFVYNYCCAESPLAHDGCGGASPRPRMHGGMIAKFAHLSIFQNLAAPTDSPLLNRTGQPRMTRILVAEDSPTQSVYVQGLLEDAGYKVECVGNGKLALRRIENGSKPDLVLTDMMMPEMDGLQLVRAIRIHHPGIPVILMTGQGTDTLAIEALEDGAASYVPKSQLNERLVDEITQVLHASRLDRTYEMLLRCLQHNEFSFALKNDVALIDPLVDLMQQMLVGTGLCDSTTRVRAGLALEHALLNAIYRGNLEISAEEMLQAREQLLHGAGSSLVQQRQEQEPYCHRTVTVHAVMTPKEATFVIRDQGQGFDTTQVPDPADPDSLEREGGHGLLLMLTFMDEVRFNERGNEVIMVIRRREPRGDKGDV
jgi:CheY-like chemotaxis protein